MFCELCLSFVLNLLQPTQGRREGGQGDTMTSGPIGRWLQRAQQRTHELESGFIEITLRNQHVKPEDLFFSFLRRSLNFDRKNR